jgi:hypothetical protein
VLPHKTDGKVASERTRQFAGWGVLLVAGVLIGYIAVRWLSHLLSEPPNAVSSELSDAPGAGTGRQRVALWLKIHRSDLTAAARRFRVDQRAIAGVIAYESLEDIHTSWTFLYRSSGPGKVHFKEGRFTEGNPVSKQVETMGLLPKRTMPERKAILGTARGAALYIGAIMSVYARLAKSHGYSIQCKPAILATYYSAWDFRTAKEYLSIMKRHDLAPNLVGSWIQQNLAWLAANVGSPSVCSSNRTTSSLPA